MPPGKQRENGDRPGPTIRAIPRSAVIVPHGRGEGREEERGASQKGGYPRPGGTIMADRGIARMPGRPILEVSSTRR